MSRTLSEASSYTAHLQSLGALVEVYTNYQRDNVAVPETLIQRIQEKLEQLVLPSIERNMTDYEAASDELLDLEIIADDLGCHHKNKAEDNACQFV
ncbi:MAG: hypothetical protein L6R42_002096, partial [Xanthoria sp. 1 TBL-2021]